MRGMLSNEDAVSELIGVILALGIAVLALSILQTTAVPIWDEELEHDHNVMVYNDFMQFRANTFSDSPDSAPIEMGFIYPNRILLRNPTRGVSGTIVTKNQTIRIKGLVGGGIEWAGNDSVEKLPLITDWAKYDTHANKSSIGGSKLSYTFNGTNLSIDFWRTDDSGFTSVSVDGISYKQINLYIHSTQYTDFNGTPQTYTIVDGLDFGTHTVEVEVMGTRSVDSSGNSVVVDGFRPGVKYVDETYTTTIVSYSADNNFAMSPDIVLEHALVLKAYNGYTYTDTSPQIRQDTIFFPLIQMPNTTVTSLESITIDTTPTETIEYLLIDADISFETDYMTLWNGSIISTLENMGVMVSASNNTVTIHCNTTTRLMMPVIVMTMSGERYETEEAIADTTPPAIGFSTSPPLAPTLTDKTKPLITSNYSDASGIDIGSVKVYLDDEAKTNFTAYADHVNYTPSTPIEPGWHNITVEVSDIYGNTGTLTSNYLFVVTEPWVDIQNPVAVSPVTVSRGFNATVNFTYTDTNAKAYTIQINNSTSVIASVVNTVPQPSGINVSVSESILINASAKEGSYDVWVWINDTTGYTNSSIEVASVNVAKAQAEHITLDSSSATLNANRIKKFSISNNATFDIIINQIIISWTPNSGELIEKVELNHKSITSWKGDSGYIPAVDSPSGTTLTLATGKNIVPAGVSYTDVRFEFDSSMTGKTFTIEFLLSDGSSKTIVFGPL